MQTRNDAQAQGIDVSHWQGNIDWNRVKAAGKQFVFIKATEGKSYRDQQFLSNVSGARAVGLLVGAYHFVNAVNVVDAKLEAANFVTRLQDAGGTASFELPPVMDYESNPGNLNKRSINAVALAFLQEVERLGGRKPIVYTGNAFAQNFEPALSDYDLWIARYSNTRVPDDAPAWKRWSFWQYTDSGQVSGIGGGVDLNVYCGTLSELKARYGSGNDGQQGGEHQMTNDEKKAFVELQALVKAQADRIAALTDSRDLLKTSLSTIDQRLQKIEQSHAMPIPEWAKSSVQKAAAAGLIQDSDGGSYDFYRLLTVLDRKGLI
ncbi:glycoside hydrolase family 25 protein [Paenibacillus campi]|uniref:glycoside hydrolase family 25 protein n=1 Tax=Paenibacillus campi TaxID=3106031 RepID=UPI002AFF021E|nr:glycoside hydrolase family 25 protein [Paenibacillus sp. SGZ-1009]